MQLRIAGIGVLSALVISACAPMISPNDTPIALRNVSADAIFAFDAEATCSGFSANEEAVEERFEDVLAEMIEVGYSSAQFDAMLVGLEVETDWFIPYLIALERKHDIDASDDAQFCNVMAQERRERSSIGRLLN
ncbi:hypothetical protein SLH49_16295 [Cognatiyoonia sp. IB215446]|uniref:hypothetical protein n=1 Tax=Cognatiyoonia sp. IB215446 TaxID=3097355 RepID=UPI002A0AFA81|nr:hypothetical protein [Cognatiyoonia sp. IB215446]MDX8349545.1 hypothetical protein [Cognatiyoonia sp. IB215446]